MSILAPPQQGMIPRLIASTQVVEPGAYYEVFALARSAAPVLSVRWNAQVQHRVEIREFAVDNTLFSASSTRQVFEGSLPASVTPISPASPNIRIRVYNDDDVSRTISALHLIDYPGSASRFVEVEGEVAITPTGPLPIYTARATGFTTVTTTEEDIASGANREISVGPTGTEVWTIRAFRLEFPAVTAEYSGLGPGGGGDLYHRIEVRQGHSTSGALSPLIQRADSYLADAVLVASDEVIATRQLLPEDEAAAMRCLVGLQLTASRKLYIRYLQASGDTVDVTPNIQLVYTAEDVEVSS